MGSQDMRSVKDQCGFSSDRPKQALRWRDTLLPSQGATYERFPRGTCKQGKAYFLKRVEMRDDWIVLIEALAKSESRI